MVQTSFGYPYHGITDFKNIFELHGIKVDSTLSWDVNVCKCYRFFRIHYSKAICFLLLWFSNFRFNNSIAAVSCWKQVRDFSINATPYILTACVTGTISWPLWEHRVFLLLVAQGNLDDCCLFRQVSWSNPFQGVSSGRYHWWDAHTVHALRV